MTFNLNNFNYDNLYKEQTNYANEKSSKKRATEDRVINPYKCIFNKNEKVYTSSSLSELKQKFEEKKQENNRAVEELRKRTTLKALITLEDSKFMDQLKNVKSSIKGNINCNYF